VWNKKIDELHMRTKCPKQLGHLPGNENHPYVPRLKIKHHLKSAKQSLENPLTHPKCVNHLWPKCNHKKFFMPKKIPNGFQSLHFDTLTLNPTRANWVKKWSKAWVISFKGPTMWVSSTRNIKKTWYVKVIFKIIPYLNTTFNPYFVFHALFLLSLNVW